jgi:SAM-dependent methyltransferase
VLDLLREHDTFVESITNVADMGCGSGLDAKWWVELETRDDNPMPLDIRCWAVDKNPNNMVVEEHPHVTFIEGNFEKRVLSLDVDVIWCHDAFQYAVNPISTLRLFNEQMVENGLLYIGIPLHNYTKDNQWNWDGADYEYYDHSVLSMIYMMAVNGFDMNDCYMRKAKDDPWLHIAAFKTSHAPMDPTTTGWYDLIERDLINQHLRQGISRWGRPRVQDVLYPWLDKENYRIQL